MKYVLIFILILICYINSFASENKITLYINNRPVDTEIFLLQDNKPSASAEILASGLNLNFKYDSNSKILYLGNKIFKGEKIVKDKIILIFLKDFSDFAELTYSYDEKARTADLRNFNVRLQENPDKDIPCQTTAAEKKGDEIKIIYERTEQGKDNNFIVYAAVQNISASILDMVVVNCIFIHPAGQVIDRQIFNLNTMRPGDYREISFSTQKPPADPGAGEGGLFYGSVRVPGGGTYSSVGLSGGTVAAQQLVTPDYKLMVNYDVRNEWKK
jgi:hypothetical protein